MASPRARASARKAQTEVSLIEKKLESRSTDLSVAGPRRTVAHGIPRYSSGWQWQRVLRWNCALPYA